MRYIRNSRNVKEGRKDMFYVTTHSTHFIYGYMTSDIWYITIQIMREEICCRIMCYSFRLAARVLLSTDRITHTTAFVTPVVEHWLEREIAQWVHPMKDRVDAPTTELHLALENVNTYRSNINNKSSYFHIV